MNTVIKDIILFVKNFLAVIKRWLNDTIVKYKFKNVALIGIAFYLRYLMAGEFGTYWGIATFYVWIGLNVEAIASAYRDLKKENGW